MLTVWQWLVESSWSKEEEQFRYHDGTGWDYYGLFLESLPDTHILEVLEVGLWKVMRALNSVMCSCMDALVVLHH